MDSIALIGKIVFSPDDKTKKHQKQSSWKKVAMVMFDGDVSEYYAWFIKKRFNLPLNKPLRGAHISFINDSIGDMSLNGQRTLEEVEILWQEVKARWDKQEIVVMLSVSPKTDAKHWWLNVPQEYRDKLQGIRNELGLGKPYYGLHLSLGYANEKNIEHSHYIHELIKIGLVK